MQKCKDYNNNYRELTAPFFKYITMKIYRVNDKHYTNYQLALLEGVKQNHAIITLEVDDTNTLEVEAIHRDLYIFDKEGNDYQVECDFYLTEEVVDRCHITGAQEYDKFYDYKNITVEGKCLSHFNFDAVIIEQIHNELQTICESKNQDKR
tara:strand:+ start:67 stop:519 length:453 start_codon:yes stop_codon:yes gene_type:complete